MTNKDRILEISKKLGLSHIGSCLSVLPILEEIYAKKKPADIVIMDNAHAHLAHLVVQGNRKSLSFQLAELETIRLIKNYGIHCDRQAGCDASGGSLGHGIGIGIGYAIANPDKEVYVIVSDGSMQEGSNWEAIRIASELELKNLVIHCNFNGFTAVKEINPGELYLKMQHHKNASRFPSIIMGAGGNNPIITDNGEGFAGVQGHYKKI